MWAEDRTDSLGLYHLLNKTWESQCEGYVLLDRTQCKTSNGISLGAENAKIRLKSQD